MRLRRYSLEEFGVRGAQLVTSLVERVPRVAHRDASDERLLRPLLRPEWRGTPDDLLAHFRTRTTAGVLPAFADMAATVAALHARHPAAATRLVARAERAAAGRFTLLGHADVAFGADIDWHLDPLSGHRAPLVHWSRVPYLDATRVGDCKLVWELNRHQHFVTLGQAYRLTGDERHAMTFVRQVTSWMDANPPSRGINWASSLEVAFRAVAWLWALELLRPSTHLTAHLLARLLRFLHAHGRHVASYLSTYFSPNTHLTGEALGLLYLGTLLPELRDAARWRATALDILHGELDRQVRPDGVYFEQATHYQRYTADFYLHALLLADAGDRPLRPRAEGTLRALVDHLLHVARPDGSMPLIGDDDGGRLLALDGRAPDDLRPLFATAAAVLGVAEYRMAGGDATEEALWLLGPRALATLDTLGDRVPAGGSRGFADGGYFVMRDGWSRAANHAVLDCGPHGALSHGHAHADALALGVYAAGRPVLVDPGTFTYTTSPAERDWFRGTAAHNTVTVDGASSSEPGGMFSWHRVADARVHAWTTAAGYDYFEGTHDGFARLPVPAVHRRAVLFAHERYWVVLDRVESAEPHGFAVHWHFAPGLAVRGGDPDRLTARGGEGAAPVLELACAGGRFEEGAGWVSPVFGRRERAPYWRRVVDAGDSRQEVVTLLAPVAHDGRCVAKVHPVAARRGRAFSLEVAGGTDLLLVGGQDGAAAERVETTGRLALVRAGGDGAPIEVVLVGAGRVEVAGRVVVENTGGALAIARRSGAEWRIVGEQHEAGARAPQDREE